MISNRKATAVLRIKPVAPRVKTSAHSIANAVLRTANAALDLAYPDDLYCICCDKIIDGSRPYRLCNECIDDIRWATGRTCAKCGKVLGEPDTDDLINRREDGMSDKLSAHAVPRIDGAELCHDCRASFHEFDRGFTCCEYGTTEKSIVFKLKFRGRTDIASTLAEIMHDKLEQTVAREHELDRASRHDLDPVPCYDLITEVPMHRKKREQRGYDQAELIAKHLARYEGVPHAKHLLERTRRTSAMKGRGRDERRQNVEGAFGINSKYSGEGGPDALHGKAILLVDDIYTTGATADACAKALKDAGAGRVDVISFAAGSDRKVSL